MARDRNSYDWIFINPPTFSRSKMSKGNFNIHKDHKTLIESADEVITSRFHVEDATKQFVPPDFTRYPFQAFRLRKRGPSPLSKG